VTDWAELLSPAQLATMLAQSFFPRWLNVLGIWLNSTPNYEEVVTWYQGWKSVIPAPLLSLPGVADQLAQALHMMNRSVTGSGPLASQPGALENVRYMTGREMQVQQSSSQVQSVKPPGTDTGNTNKFDTIEQAVKTSAAIPQGYKELIGRRCEERGIVWRPIPGQWREGKQLYLCGQRRIYLDKTVIFVMEGNVWVPTSLNNLLDKAFDSGN